MADGLGFDAIEKARAAILAQIEERDQFYPDAAPVYPWDIVARAQSYVLRLPADDLRSIRLHCGAILGENTPAMLFGGNACLSDYFWLGEGIDPALWAYEPEVPALGEGLGAEVFGRRVNANTGTIQRYLCNLLRLGLADGQHVVEIGAGYGGLAHAILSARRVRYTVIDLPETLIFSAAFLSHNFPDRKIYVYHPGDGPEWMSGADIVLLPNYRADWLEPCDIAINTVSFPEMSREALKAYVALLGDRLKPDGLLMSVNYHGDRGDGLGVPDFIAERFDLFHEPAVICKLTGRTWLQYRDLNFRPTIIATHRGKAPPGALLRDIIAGERFERHAITVPVMPDFTSVVTPASP